MQDVAINVIGKYRYRMASPVDHTWAPVVVDIILVGRTKIITLHSCVWVENGIERPLRFRLHVPISSLVPPPAGVFNRRREGDSGDQIIGPLDPGQGEAPQDGAGRRRTAFLHAPSTPSQPCCGCPPPCSSRSRSHSIPMHFSRVPYPATRTHSPLTRPLRLPRVRPQGATCL